MWNLLTYAYNTLLVIFIATHLLVGALISFLVGLYLGIYLCQNYTVPRITEPSALYEKTARFLEQHRLRNIRPAAIISLLKENGEIEAPVLQASLHIHPQDAGKEDGLPSSTPLISTHSHLE